MASVHMQNSDDYRGGKFETSASRQGVNNIPRGEGKGYICLKAKLTQRERDKNTVVTLSVRLQNCKGCLGPFANIVQTAFKDFFYKFLNLAFKSRASLIHLNN